MVDVVRRRDVAVLVDQKSADKEKRKYSHYIPVEKRRSLLHPILLLQLSNAFLTPLSMMVCSV